MKYVIIDDEPNAIKLIESMVGSSFPDYELIGTAQTVEDALNMLTEVSPNLVFLDIMLGEETGFDLLESIENPEFQVIFTTAHDNFALQAFKYKAIHYLLKPIVQDQLIEAVKRVKPELKNNYDDLLSAIRAVQEPGQKKIALPNRNGVEIIQQDQVLYCRAAGSYTDVYLVNGQKRTISRPIGRMELILNKHEFCRIHRTHIVNLNEVAFLERSKSPVLHLKSGDTLEVSKSYKEKLYARLKEQIEFMTSD